MSLLVIAEIQADSLLRVESDEPVTCPFANASHVFIESICFFLRGVANHEKDTIISVESDSRLRLYRLCTQRIALFIGLILGEHQH